MSSSMTRGVAYWDHRNPETQSKILLDYTAYIWLCTNGSKWRQLDPDRLVNRSSLQLVPGAHRGNDNDRKSSREEKEQSVWLGPHEAHQGTRWQWSCRKQEEEKEEAVFLGCVCMRYKVAAAALWDRMTAAGKQGQTRGCGERTGNKGVQLQQAALRENRKWRHNRGRRNWWGTSQKKPIIQFYFYHRILFFIMVLIMFAFFFPFQH